MMNTQFRVVKVTQATSLAVHIWGTNSDGELWRTTFSTHTMERSAFVLWLADQTAKRGQVVDLFSEYDGDTDNFWVNVHTWRFHSTDFFDWR